MKTIAKKLFNVIFVTSIRLTVNLFFGLMLIAILRFLFSSESIILCRLLITGKYSR